MEEKEKLSKRGKQIQNELIDSPDGSLRLSRNGRCWQWKLAVKGKPATLITKKEKDLAVRLCAKKYLEWENQSIQKRLMLIAHILEHYPAPADTLSCVERLFKDSRPGAEDEFLSLLSCYMKLESSDPSEWEVTEYVRNSEYPERLIVPTKAGIPVRSKSEAMIANELFDRKIPFRYEEELLLGGSELPAT